MKKLFHRPNCRGCRGLYIEGEAISGLCTCIPFSVDEYEEQCSECNGTGVIENQIIGKYNDVLESFFQLYLKGQKERGAKSGFIDFFKARTFLLESLINQDFKHNESDKLAVIKVNN